jgi:ribosomal RNA-processing protein 9
MLLTVMSCLPWQIWSLDDRAYVDTLFGHQADVLAIDARRTERVLTVGADHTCRVWKVPEESQLIYRHGLNHEFGAHHCALVRRF